MYKRNQREANRPKGVAEVRAPELLPLNPRRLHDCGAQAAAFPLYTTTLQWL
jgi:hypothetical protein